MSLEELSTRRDENNLNLIQFLAAGAVLASHAWPILQGPQAVEPLRQLTGHSLGGMAVYVFFAISGFLVTSSVLRSPSLGDFLLARALRLFPAEAVSKLGGML